MRALIAGIHVLVFSIILQEEDGMRNSGPSALRKNKFGIANRVYPICNPKLAVKAE